MRSNSLALLAALAAMIAVVLLCVMFVPRPPTIPPDFQYQSNFSRAEAELFYAKARHELRQSYWTTIRRDLKSWQFKYAWTHFKNGEGHIEGVISNPNNDVMAFIKLKRGNSYWITVQEVRDRALAKRR